MKYSIIIPAHNSETTITGCINSILQSKFSQQYELILVDDASTDKTALLAKNLSAKVISYEKCLGPAAARNRGAQEASGNILVFIDADILLFEDTLQKIDWFLTEKKDFSALSCNLDPRCAMSDGLSRYKHLYLCYYLSKQPQEVSWTFSSTLAIQKEAFQAAGGFNPASRHLEDTLLGRKLTQKGFRLAFAGQIPVQHLRRYTFRQFFNTELNRARALTRIKYADFSRTAKADNNIVVKNIRYSIYLFPFLLASIFLINTDPRVFITLTIIYYLINARFLRYCKNQFGIKFMLQAAGILPLDTLLCWIGILWGSLDFLGGKKL